MISEGRNKKNGNDLLDLYDRIVGRERPCVFISHHKEDAEQCRVIVSYLKKVGIHYYFDEDDADLQSVTGKNDPKKITELIIKGLKASTHVLCVLSPNTLSSKWVPFEVGYAYRSNYYITVLTLKNIPDKDLPEYIFAVDRIRGEVSMKEYVKSISSSSYLLTEVEERTKVFSGEITEELSAVLDPGK